ncbi:MAG: T9SS type A sorting domain-containing protein [Flavobacteriales bacterium]|nr:T9SS type A sorting domain-containing protein [Flavobacteriales bacterium]
MRDLYPLGLAMMLWAGAATAQQPFTNSTSMLDHPAHSGGCMGVTDMDGDGLDDVVQLDGSEHVHVLYQEADGTFTAYDYGSVSNSSQWGWAIADLANDGHKDIVSGGSYDGTHLVSITARGVSSHHTLNGPQIFQQNMSIGDVDNDGRVDVFACNDNGAPNLWFTDANGMPQINNTYINWSTTPPSDMSGNYGSCFTDFDSDGDLDLYIAKCRQGVNNPDDPRRWNRLFVNDGNNNYSDQAAAYGVDDHEQTWASDFGDFDNDGDLDQVSVEHSTGTQLFKNDGTGHFTNVTNGSGLGLTSFPLQVLFRDLDNDGFLDILIAGGSEFFFKGNGDGTFTEVEGLFPYSKAMHSFAFGDLNRDGFEDVYANYGNSYVTPSETHADILWTNVPNGNHYFRVRLQGTVSNRDAIGARVTINGPWGTQVREIRSGESYGLVNSFVLHFGLGAETTIPSMTVTWPSGLEETFTDLHADQTITVVENTCISPNVAITATPTGVLCPGAGPITLTASPGSDYTWSTGAAGASIPVSDPGNYWTVTGTGNCITQASRNIQESPDETPTVTADGPTQICPMDQVTLTASPADGYTWSNGSDQQSIVVNTPGEYTVTIQGACAEFTSAPVQVSLLDAPDAPLSMDVSIPVPGTSELTATGDSILWYDAATGGNLLGTGSPWTTPMVNTNTSFWCADMVQNGGETYYGGKTNRSENQGVYQNNSTYYLYFTADEDMVIKSAKVYANGAGNRTIALVDQASAAVIISGIYNIPDGESRVQLNIPVEGGGNYGLRILSGDPQLWRDGLGSFPDFPYDLGGLGAITGSNAGSDQYYYYFYDWEVATPSTWCEGPRTEVEVLVGPTGIGGLDDNRTLGIYPNPATDRINLQGDLPAGATQAEVIDVSGRICLTADLRNGSLSVSGLAKGHYTLQVRGHHATVRTSFIKQ